MEKKEKCHDFCVVSNKIIMNIIRFGRRMYCSANSTIKKPPVPVFGMEGRYVTALYSAASELDELDEVEEHLRDLHEQLKTPVMVDFIETSIMSRAAKAELLMSIGDEAGMPETAKNFLALVAENGRLKLLKRMITMFLTVMAAHRNHAPCEVITAKPLDDSNRNALMEALKNFVGSEKTIQLTEKIDPSIMGGMIVGVEDKHIDMSIARKIQKYTEILKKSL